MAKKWMISKIHAAIRLSKGTQGEKIGKVLNSKAYETAYGNVEIKGELPSVV